MTLPDGYSDVPAGKIAAVVNHLEMTKRPAPRPNPPGAWTLRKVDSPSLDWFRDLYRRVGEEWLWFSRIRASDEKLAARLHHPLVETYALVADGSDEGLLELDPFVRTRVTRTFRRPRWQVGPDPGWRSLTPGVRGSRR